MEARNKIKIEVAPLCDLYKKKSSRTAVYRETTHVQMCSDSIKCIHTCLSFLKIYKKNGTHKNLRKVRNRILVQIHVSFMGYETVLYTRYDTIKVRIYQTISRVCVTVPLP